MDSGLPQVACDDCGGTRISAMGPNLMADGNMNDLICKNQNLYEIVVLNTENEKLDSMLYYPLRSKL